MQFDRITNENFLLYCSQHYDNPQCHNLTEFYEDIKRIKYLKKLFTRYDKTGDLKERLILNHIIILNNVFGQEHVLRILFYKIDKYWHLLKPFLILLNILPAKVTGIGPDAKTIYTDDIKMDPGIIEVLRKI